MGLMDSSLDGVEGTIVSEIVNDELPKVRLGKPSCTCWIQLLDLSGEKRGFVGSGAGGALTMVRHSVTIFAELETVRAL